jgi:hypothetical protein
MSVTVAGSSRTLDEASVSRSFRDTRSGRERDSAQAATETADLIVDTPGERLPEWSGARAEPAVDTGLDVLPRILDAEFQCRLERRADEEALAGHVVDVGFQIAQWIGALQMSAPTVNSAQTVFRTWRPLSPNNARCRCPEVHSGMSVSRAAR